MWYENDYDNHNFFNVVIYLYKLYFLSLIKFINFSGINGLLCETIY